MERPDQQSFVTETDRLILRQWDVPDFPALHALLSHRETMKQWPTPFSESDARSWFEKARLRYRERGFGRWAVCLKANGTVIGDCGLMPIEIDGEPVTDLGYIIQADHHGHGFGVEAARAVLHVGSGRFGLSDIVCHMAEDHDASIKVAERVGLVLTGSFINPRNRNKRHLIYRPTE